MAIIFSDRYFGNGVGAEEALLRVDGEDLRGVKSHYAAKGHIRIVAGWRTPEASPQTRNIDRAVGDCIGESGGRVGMSKSHRRRGRREWLVENQDSASTHATVCTKSSTKS